MRFDFNAIAGNKGWQQLRRHGPLLLGLLLAVAAAWQAAALTWSAIEVITTEPTLPPPARIAAQSETGNAATSMASVATMHLFGTAETAPETLAAAAADAPETRLNLKLRGILAADPSEYSRAIIGSGNEDKVYSVGAALPGGANVEAVLADRVVLRRAGRLETLRLPRDTADSGVSYEEPPAREETAQPDFAQMRQEIVQDPTRLSELLRYSPVLENGEIRGYRVYPSRDRARFSQMGLQPGDVVTAINGTPLSDPGQAMEMLNNLTDASNITLTVERNGSPQDITLSPSQ